MKYFGVILPFIVAKCLLQVHGSLDLEDDGIFRSSLSVGVTYGNHLYSNGIIVLGPGIECTVKTLGREVSKVSAKSLAKILGVGSSIVWSNKGNILDALKRWIIAQSEKPDYGAINYETAMVFAEAFMEYAPETAAALKTVSYLMKTIKDNKGSPLLREKITSALYHFYGESQLRPYHMDVWQSMTTPIYKVTKGNAKVAENFVTSLGEINDDLKGLKQGDPGRQYNILKTVIDNAVNYPKSVTKG